MDININIDISLRGILLMDSNTCRKCICNYCKFFDKSYFTCLIFNEKTNSCQYHKKHKQCPIKKCEHYIYWEG